MADRKKMASHDTKPRRPSPDEVPTTSSSSTTSSPQPAAGYAYRSEESFASHPETVGTRVIASEPSFHGTAGGDPVNDESPWPSSEDDYAKTYLFNDSHSNACVPGQRQESHGGDRYANEVRNYRRIKLNETFQTCPALDKDTGVQILKRQRKTLNKLKAKLESEGYNKWSEAMLFVKELMGAINEDIDLVDSERECVRIVDSESYEKWRERNSAQKQGESNSSQHPQEYGSGTMSHYQPDMMHDFPPPQHTHSGARAPMTNVPPTPGIQVSDAPGLSGLGLPAHCLISAPVMGLPQHQYVSSAGLEAYGGSEQDALRERWRVFQENIEPYARHLLQQQQQQHRLLQQQQLQIGQTSRHDNRFPRTFVPGAQHGQYGQLPPTGPSAPMTSIDFDTGQVQVFHLNPQVFTSQTHQDSGTIAGYSYPNASLQIQQPFYGTTVVHAGQGQGQVGQQQFPDFSQQGYTPQHGAPPLRYAYAPSQVSYFSFGQPSPHYASVGHPRHAYPQQTPMMGQTPDQGQQNTGQYQFPQVQVSMEPQHPQGHQATMQWQHSSGEEEMCHQPQPTDFMEPHHVPIQPSSQFQHGGQQLPPHFGQQLNQGYMVQSPPLQGYLPTEGQQFPGVPATLGAIAQNYPAQTTEAEPWNGGTG